MKQINVDIPEAHSEPTRRPLVQRVTPLGWLTAAVLGFFIVSLILFLGKTLTACTTGLDDLLTITPATPTPPTPTPTSLYPTATPTPEGWTVETNVIGSQYLSPPAADEEAITEAFDAVMACYSIQDAADSALLEFDRDANLEALQRLAVPVIVEYCHNHEVVAIAELGLYSQVQCETYSTCRISRAQLGSFGLIGYTEQACLASPGEIPCIMRSSEFQIIDEQPCFYLIATAIHQEDTGGWTVTELQITPFECQP